MPVDLANGLIARWKDPDPGHVELLRQAGVEAVVLSSPSAPFSQACAASGIQTLAASEIERAAHSEGSWPGVSRQANVAGRGDETASASRDPWIEINGYLAAYWKALFPDRPALLAYPAPSQEQMVPNDSVELALIEARVSGGNYVLDLPPRYREGLLGGDQKARSAWQQLGRTARWLREQRALLDSPVYPQVTQLVDEGDATAEIAKLLFRRNVSPRLEAAARPPAPNPERLALVAVELEQPSDQVRNRILTHADAGTSVIVNGKWWHTSRMKLLRKEEDRDVYEFGKGRVIAYHEPISDPSEFAMDVIDIITHKRRAARLWNAPSVVALACGKGILKCINYGSRIDVAIQARIYGTFSKATLLRPEGPPVTLKTALRSGSTEVQIPEIRRLGMVVFG